MRKVRTPYKKRHCRKYSQHMLSESVTETIVNTINLKRKDNIENYYLANTCLVQDKTQKY